MVNTRVSTMKCIPYKSHTVVSGRAVVRNVVVVAVDGRAVVVESKWMPQ